MEQQTTGLGWARRKFQSDYRRICKMVKKKNLWIITRKASFSAVVIYHQSNWDILPNIYFQCTIWNWGDSGLIFFFMWSSLRKTLNWTFTGMLLYYMNFLLLIFWLDTSLPRKVHWACIKFSVWSLNFGILGTGLTWSL